MKNEDKKYSFWSKYRASNLLPRRNGFNTFDKQNLLRYLLLGLTYVAMAGIVAVLSKTALASSVIFNQSSYVNQSRLGMNDAEQDIVFYSAYMPYISTSTLASSTAIEVLVKLYEDDDVAACAGDLSYQARNSVMGGGSAAVPGGPLSTSTAYYLTLPFTAGIRTIWNDSVLNNRDFSFELVSNYCAITVYGSSNENSFTAGEFTHTETGTGTTSTDPYVKDAYFLLIGDRIITPGYQAFLNGASLPVIPPTSPPLLTITACDNNTTAASSTMEVLTCQIMNGVKSGVNSIAAAAQSVLTTTINAALNIFPLSIFYHINTDFAAVSPSTSSITLILNESLSPDIFGGRSFTILGTSTMDTAASNIGFDYKSLLDKIIYAATGIIIIYQTIMIIGHLRKENSFNQNA